MFYLITETLGLDGSFEVYVARFKAFKGKVEILSDRIANTHVPQFVNVKPITGSDTTAFNKALNELNSYNQTIVASRFLVYQLLKHRESTPNNKMSISSKDFISAVQHDEKDVEVID